MKNTIVVNLFAGPGAGKSTCATYVFSKLKMLGVDVEYVSEFAKDKCWEQNEEVFKCQLYITGKQAFKICRVNGKVDVIISDSPIATGGQHCKEKPIQDAIFYEFKKYNNFNVFLQRNLERQYDQNGRHETLEQSIDIDNKIKEWMVTNNIEHISINADITDYDKLANIIYDKIKLLHNN